MSAILLGTAHAQLLGSTDLISKSSYCKKYTCQYIKLDKTGGDELWTYYVSKRLNFDVRRDAGLRKSVLYGADLRFVGGTLKDADIPLISDFFSAVIGFSPSAAMLKKCGAANSDMTLYRSAGFEGFDFITCRRVDSTEIVFESGVFAP